MVYIGGNLAGLALCGCLATFCALAQPSRVYTHTTDSTLRIAIIRELGDLGELGLDPNSLKFVSRRADLNGDGRPELLVWVPTIGYGGTSGYPLLIFRREKQGLKLLSMIEPVWTPLIVSNYSRHGWRDIIMQVGGGGEQMRYVVFRHNGKSYSDNFREIGARGVQGRRLIGKDWQMSTFGPIPPKE